MSEGKSINTTTLAKTMAIVLICYGLYEAFRIGHMMQNITRAQLFDLLDRLVCVTSTLLILAYTSYYSETCSSVKLNIAERLPFSKFCAEASYAFLSWTLVYGLIVFIFILTEHSQLALKYILAITIILCPIFFIMIHKFVMKYIYAPWVVITSDKAVSNPAP